MKKIFSILSITLSAVIFISCNETLKIYEGTALGLPQKSYEVSTVAGSIHVDVISNSEYDITSNVSWATSPSKGQGRDGFDVDYTGNEGVARIATFIISIGQTHRDTMILRQRGKLIPQLSVDQTNITLEGSGTKTVALSTNLRDDEIFPKVYFPQDSVLSWVSKVKIENSKLFFDYEPNPYTSLRSARIDLNYVDEYGYMTCVPIYLTQKGNDGSAGTVCSFEQLRFMASVEGTEITEDLVIEGISVGNPASGNMGDNMQLAIVGIDYSICQKTIYLESMDGSYGFRILCKSEEDNVFGQFDATRILLKGMKLYKHVSSGDNDPEYYWMEGFSSFMILGREASAAPVKERTIATLTDNDIFTYVTLKNCQLPFRKGSLTPIDERLSNAANVNKINKFAINLYDSQGASIYLYTNTTCLYRRDGHILPYGSGDMKGIVVHELYTRFSYQDNESGDADTYGNIGRYQLRHTSLDDFCMQATMDGGSFSHIIAEWRYILAANQEKYYATDGDNTAFFQHSCTNTTSLYDDFSYLGPVGTKDDGFFGKNVGNINGLGVILENGADWMGPEYVGPNSENAYKVNNISSAPGSGVSPSTIGASWATNVNYNTSKGLEPAGFVLNFSTKGITASHLSLHLSMMSLYVKGKYSTGPRHFHVYYSTDNSLWKECAKFTLPDFACQDNPVTQLWQTPGYMQMTFALPASLCNKDKVYVRIFPDKDRLVGTYTEYLTDYTASTDKNIPRTLYNYIGIRYND